MSERRTTIELGTVGRHTWQAMGATFMGNRLITHWCLCGGYRERTSGGEQP